MMNTKVSSQVEEGTDLPIPKGCLTDHLFNGWNGEDGATRAETEPATSPEGSAPGPVLTSSDV